MTEKKEKRLSVRELIDRYQVNCDRVNEIAEACEKEQRERTEAENKEFEAITRENQILQMKMQALHAQTMFPREQPGADPDEVLRETLLVRDQKVTVQLVRETGGTSTPPATTTTAEPTVTPQTTTALDGTGIIPVYEQEMLKPIRKGLIYDKVGLNIRSGLSGTLRWPKHGKAVASFADEGLVDSSISWDKLETNGHRMGIAVPVTREELEDSHGIVDSVVREEMPKSIIDLINSALFTTSGTYTDKNGKSKNRKVYGPFVKAASSATQFAGTVPTRRELLLMVAAVADKVDLIAPCWVMTEAMKAELQDVKVDSGSGRFLCENNTILGYPVYTTSEIGSGNIGFGDWSYQAAGFFGDWNLVVDPYTLARNNSVDFVLNARFGTVTLREDAFVLGKTKAS